MSPEPKGLLKWSVWAWPGTDLVRLEDCRGGDVTLRLGHIEAIVVEDVEVPQFTLAGLVCRFDIQDAPSFPMLRELRNRWSDFLAERGTAFLPRNLPVEQAEAAQ